MLGDKTVISHSIERYTYLIASNVHIFYFYKEKIRLQGIQRG